MHTGVKSAGCENRIAQLSPIQEWKSIFPWVVSAWKLGAMLPRRRWGCSSEIVARERRRRGEMVVGRGRGRREGVRVERDRIEVRRRGKAIVL